MLNVISTDGGSPREIAQPDGIFRNTLAWTPDGSRVLFGAWRTIPKATFGCLRRRWRRAPKAGSGALQDRGIECAPGRERIAFTSGVYDEEIWMMENFLPELRAAK